MPFKFNIEEYPVNQTAIQFEFNIVDVPGDFVNVFYRLIKANGSDAETGNKMIPRTALQILAAPVLSLEALNQLLAEWGIVATEIL